ncbi:MAG TPA: ATP-binding protein [Puia sp.]|nr:ATP-binding protein [Puia sp.]
MKKLIVHITILFQVLAALAQTPHIDSLREKLLTATDTLRPFLLNAIAEEITRSLSSFTRFQKDSLLYIAKNDVVEAEASSRKCNYNGGIGIALFLSGLIKVDFSTGNYVNAIVEFTNALPYLKSSNNEQYLSRCYDNLAKACHWMGKIDCSINYYDSAMKSYSKIGDSSALMDCMMWQGHDYFDKGDYKTAYLYAERVWNTAKKTRNISLMIDAAIDFENLFLGAGLPERTVDYFDSIRDIHPLSMPLKGKTTLGPGLSFAVLVAGEAYLKLNKPDSAISLSQFVPEDTADGDNERFYGSLYTALHQDDNALQRFLKAVVLKKKVGHVIGLAGTAIELGQTFLKKKNYKSAIYYTNYGLVIAESIPALLEMRNAVGILSDIYAQTGNYKQTYHFSQLYKSMSDSLSSEEDRRRLSLELIQNELNNQKQQAALLSKENQIKQQQLQNETLLRNFFIAGALTFLLIAIILYRNYKQKQNANNLLLQQKKEIQATLSELKLTQAQLIQSEKMASLGELTSGIAHEIQNPLNFMNNFSEVNKELLVEMKGEMNKGNIDDANAIADDVISNEEKINHHGKRADAIVKGMLQHSRTSAGQNEPTDINVLAGEYLRLAYHGLKAKDDAFNVIAKTDFDTTIGNINIIPQDIGRVLLNLYNNAFYAVSEKKQTAGAGFEPTVSVSTRKTEKKITIIVKDNGDGIPQKVIDKIFQPFFTTKPTGQGTGLGLSLSYDIVKAHGGEISVNTKEGEYTEFTIELPV